MGNESGNDVDPSAGDGSFEAVMEGKTGVCACLLEPAKPKTRKCVNEAALPP